MHEEAAIIAGKHGDVPDKTFDKTFGELLERYANEMSVIKRGERLRIALACREAIKQYQQKVTNANPGLESRSESPHTYGCRNQFILTYCQFRV